nr:4Fe-4S single cluster domain-containing protein [Candidatus Sigynarchaeota archaeon]
MMTCDVGCLNVARIIPASYVNGPGKRAVIWFQGCMKHCEGCFNPTLWSPEKRYLLTPQELYAKIKIEPGIEGVTLTGGEPMIQHKDLVPFLELVKKDGLSVICFTGLSMAEIKAEMMEAALQHVDVLIAGSYDRRSTAEKGAKICSPNKTFHFLSGRYTRADFENLPEVEIHISDDGIDITGFPTTDLLEVLDLNMSSEKKSMYDDER